MGMDVGTDQHTDDRPGDELMDDDAFAKKFFATDLSDVPSPVDEDGEADGGAPAARAGRRGRHPAMMVAVIVASAVLQFLFWEDTAYWLSGRGGAAAAGPADLGDSMRWRDTFRGDPTHVPAEFTHNRWVQVAGLTAFRTEAAEDSQAFLKIAYVPLYVHLRDEAPAKPTDNLVHLTVSGRLLDLTRTNRYSGVQRFYAESFGLPTRKAWMLVAQDRPDAYWWAAAMQLVFATFILVNGYLLVRALRER